MHTNRLKSFTAVDAISMHELGAGYGEKVGKRTEILLLKGRSGYIYQAAEHSKVSLFLKLLLLWLSARSLFHMWGLFTSEDTVEDL